MEFSSQKLKEKMLELTRLFCIERNLFQKFVIVYKYIKLLNKDPLAKGIMQKIFDDALKAFGNVNAEFLNEGEFTKIKGEAIYSDDFWLYYSNLEVIHDKMGKLKMCKICDKGEFENLCRLFSKPYSKEMLALSFKVVNSNVFDRLDQECFLNGQEEKEGKTWFDEKRSVLYIKGERIPIGGQSLINNSHKILKYIFIANKENISDQFFYSEIAEDEFGDTEYGKNDKSWRKYHTACERIQKKVVDNTKENIKDFLIFNTGRKGSVRLNKKYF